MKGQEVNGMHLQWKQGQVTWKEYRDIAQWCRDRVRKVKAQLELNLARDTKINKKGFCRYVSQKRKVKKSLLPMMNKTGKLVTTDKKAGILNNFLALVFTSNLSFHTSRVDVPQGRDWDSKVPPIVGEDQVRDHLRNLNMSIGPNEIHHSPEGID